MAISIDARRSAPRTHPRVGVRQRAIICSLAALLALLDWGWASPTSLRGTTEPMVTGVSMNGTRVDLACRGRGPATIVLVGEPLVRPVIDDAVQAQLARSVQLCTLTVREGAANYSSPPLADVLRGLLIGGKVPGPYAFVSHASESTVSVWVTGPLAAETAGFVLVDPSSSPTSHLVIATDGEQWPLPTNDTEATALAILKLFWPADEESLAASAPTYPEGPSRRG